MLVAIEGVDRTGKSTLASELQDAWQAEVIHAGRPEYGSLFEYEDTIAAYDPLEGDHVILDRWHVGEYVWPEIFKRPTDMTDPAIRRHVEMFMCSRGCVVIYATRDYDELREDLVANDEPLRPAALPLALQRFDEALNYGHNRGFVFEHDHRLRHLSPDDITFVAAQASEDVWPLHGITRRWIGHPNPVWAIVTSGYGDDQIAGVTSEIPGRAESELDPTVANILREIPEQAWRGFALADVTGMHPDAFAEFARLADPLHWVCLGEEARELVYGLGARKSSFSPNYRVLGSPSMSDVMAAWMMEEEAWPE